MDKEHKQTDKRLAIMEKHLTQVYERANKDVGKNWKEYLDKVNEEITNLQKEYDDAKLSGDKDLIKKAGMKLGSTKREKTMLNKHYKNLTSQLAEELLHVNETALAYVNHQLPDIYSLNYNGLAETVDGIGGYSFELTDANTVRNLATRNNNLLPYKKVDGRKDIRWNTKKINNEVLQGILLGEPMDKIAKRLGTVLDMNKSSAIRNARTSVTSAENKGRQDSYEQAEKDGIQLEKEWVSTHDSRTRYSHSMLNGQKIPIGEKFKSVLGELEYPADPNGVPADIYNCRCTVVASVIGFDKIQVEEAMKEKELPAKLEKPLLSSKDAHYDYLLKKLKDKQIDYLPVREYVNALNQEEIIKAVGGGDLTQGSCASLALAYIGQKQGWSVHDYRDGKSRKFFAGSYNLFMLSKCKGLTILDADGASSVTVGNRLLKQTEAGKEYFLCVGRHASIVRRTEEGKLQYLELQSAKHSGWHDFGSKPRETLRWRFGCSPASGTSSIQDFMIDIDDSNFNTDEFKSLLGYINTEKEKQVKGVGGHEK